MFFNVFISNNFILQGKVCISEQSCAFIISFVTMFDVAYNKALSALKGVSKVFVGSVEDEQIPRGSTLRGYICPLVTLGGTAANNSRTPPCSFSVQESDELFTVTVHEPHKSPHFGGFIQNNLPSQTYNPNLSSSVFFPQEHSTVPYNHKFVPHVDTSHLVSSDTVVLSPQLGNLYAGNYNTVYNSTYNMYGSGNYHGMYDYRNTVPESELVDNHSVPVHSNPAAQNYNDGINFIESSFIECPGRNSNSSRSKTKHRKDHRNHKHRTHQKNFDHSDERSYNYLSNSKRNFRDGSGIDSGLPSASGSESCLRSNERTNDSEEVISSEYFRRRKLPSSGISSTQSSINFKKRDESAGSNVVNISPSFVPNTNIDLWDYRDNSGDHQEPPRAFNDCKLASPVGYKPFCQINDDDVRPDTKIERGEAALPDTSRNNEYKFGDTLDPPSFEADCRESSSSKRFDPSYSKPKPKRSQNKLNLYDESMDVFIESTKDNRIYKSDLPKKLEPSHIELNINTNIETRPKCESVSDSFSKLLTHSRKEVAKNDDTYIEGFSYPDPIAFHNQTGTEFSSKDVKIRPVSFFLLYFCSVFFIIINYFPQTLIL